MAEDEGLVELSEPAGGSSQRGGSLRRLERDTLVAAIILVLGTLLIWLWQPAFFQSGNISNVLLQAGILGVVTLGQTMVLLVAGIDLSVAAVMSASLVVIASLSRVGGLSLMWIVLAALALGVLVGLVNGLLVAYKGVAPFITTLGMAAVVGGAQLAYTKGSPAGTVPDSLRPLGLDGVGLVPYAAMVWLGVAVLLWALLRLTTFGRHLYATGTSPKVAARAGVRVRLVTLSTYVACGLLAAAAGVILSAYVGYVDPGVGLGYDLDSIAAAVVGGVAFTGGRGGVVGACAGVLLLTVLLNLVILAGVDPNMQLVVRGVVIVIALAIVAFRFSDAHRQRRMQ